MAFEKHYPNRKDWRRPYDYYRKYDKRAIDASCRPNGGCPYCIKSRMYGVNKAMERMDQEMREWQTTQ